MENKKGSHVGMILSFALFITFVVFIYTIVNPTINTSESASLPELVTEDSKIFSV